MGGKTNHRFPFSCERELNAGICISVASPNQAHRVLIRVNARIFRKCWNNTQTSRSAACVAPGKM